MNESLTHIFDKAFEQSTMTIKDSIQATTGWARVLWQRMKEPAGEIVGRKLLYFLRVPKTGSRFGRQFMHPRLAS